MTERLTKAEKTAIKLIKMDREEREVWEKWGKSKEGGKPGDLRYMEIFLAISDRRCKLLGLYPEGANP
jgi:hypothetical protein